MGGHLPQMPPGSAGDYPIILAIRGVRRGRHWAMAFPLGAEGAGRPLRLFGALQSRICVQIVFVFVFTEMCDDEKSLRKAPPCVYRENLVGWRPQASLGALQ